MSGLFVSTQVSQISNPLVLSIRNKTDVILKVFARQFSFEAKPLSSLADKIPATVMGSFLDTANQVSGTYYERFSS